jgi:hypothetical protein
LRTARNSAQKLRNGIVPHSRVTIVNSTGQRARRASMKATSTNTM